ncbi:MAG: hypothetical protein ACI8Z1_000507 [Candidatus Azotimanducaceae bacterium]|jgi:hypothetical protein
MKSLWMLVLLSTTVSAWGEENDSTQTENEPSVSQTNTETVEPPGDNPDQDTENDEPPDSIGDAFKNFRPSEEISADNPVPFPVDI